MQILTYENIVPKVTPPPIPAIPTVVHSPIEVNYDGIQADFKLYMMLLVLTGAHQAKLELLQAHERAFFE